MKKILYVGFFLIGISMFTGCDSKVLECSKDDSYNDEMKMVQNLKITFKNDSIKKLSIDMNVELGESYIEYKDSLIESVESEYATLKDSSAVDYSTSKKDNGFNFKLSADIDKMEETEKENLYIVNTGHSYEKAKAEFENDGYTCK